MEHTEILRPSRLRAGPMIEERTPRVDLHSEQRVILARQSAVSLAYESSIAARDRAVATIRRDWSRLVTTAHFEGGTGGIFALGYQSGITRL